MPGHLYVSNTPASVFFFFLISLPLPLLVFFVVSFGLLEQCQRIPLIAPGIIPSVARGYGSCNAMVGRISI